MVISFSWESLINVSKALITLWTKCKYARVFVSSSSKWKTFSIAFAHNPSSSKSRFKAVHTLITLWTARQRQKSCINGCNNLTDFISIDSNISINSAWRLDEWEKRPNIFEVIASMSISNLLHVNLLMLFNIWSEKLAFIIRAVRHWCQTSLVIYLSFTSPRAAGLWRQLPVPPAPLLCHIVQQSSKPGLILSLAGHLILGNAGSCTQRLQFHAWFWRAVRYISLRYFFGIKNELETSWENKFDEDVCVINKVSLLSDLVYITYLRYYSR